MISTIIIIVEIIIAGSIRTGCIRVSLQRPIILGRSFLVSRSSLPICRLYLRILLILLIWSLCLKMRLKFKMSKFRGAGIAVMCAEFMGFCSYVQTDAAVKTFDMDTTLFTPTVYYRNNGLALSFIVNLRYLKIDKPEGYSQEELAKIQDAISSENSDSNVSADNIDLTKKPNIVVIMNEAFSDLSVLGGITSVFVV